VLGKIFDIKKFAIHDGPGIRTTIFFQGCPLECQWCHNPECLSSELLEIDPGNDNHRWHWPTTRDSRKIGQKVSVESVLEEIVSDEIFYDQSGGGVTFSGGEPMMQIDFLWELLDKCREQGIHTAVDTSGLADSADFERIYHLTDLFLYDLKLIDNDAHQQYTGSSNELVLSNLNWLSSRDGKVQIRVPLVPGITDTDTNLQAISDAVTSLGNIHEISLLPYNKMGEDKYQRFNIPLKTGPYKRQTDEELAKRSTIFQSAGLKVKIGG
jgi:pyruvate formate lyase activating enzyme